MTCEFLDDSTRPQDLPSGDIDLKILQDLALRRGKLADEVWYAPLPYAFLNQSLAGKSGKVLVIGCGTGRDAESFQLESSDDVPMPEVVGIDINEQAIKKAQDGVVLSDPTGWGPGGGWRVAEPTSLVADITKEETGGVLLRENCGPFDVATFVGVLGSLITSETVSQALKNTAGVLKPKGKVVISDFGWWQSTKEGDDYWRKRYRRDAAALRLCGYKGPVFGTIVIHPFGLPNKELLSLSADDVARAIRENKYERFVRHWRVRHLKWLLEKTGFRVLGEDEKVKSWNPAKWLDHIAEEDYVEDESDKLMNYQLLAQLAN